MWIQGVLQLLLFLGVAYLIFLVFFKKRSDINPNAEEYDSQELQDRISDLNE